MVSVATPWTWPFDVRKGIAARSVTNTPSRTRSGMRSMARTAAPNGPLGPRIRSPERLTHSSAPICGPEGAGASADTSDLLQHGHPAEPGRPDEHEDHEDREDDEVLEGGREVAGGERLCEAHEQPAEHRPGDVADAADDRRGEGLQPDAEARVGVEARLDDPPHHAGRTCERPSEQEGDHDHA